MGFLKWLLGQSERIATFLPDRIWLTQEAKLAGISAELEKSLRTPKPPAGIVLASHFEENLATLRALGEQRSAPVEVTRADRLHESAIGSSPLTESQTVLILVDERHPLRDHDVEIIEFARSLSCRAQVAFHVSLEDPLMRHFVGDWVQNILKKLGMSEGEAIESAMVSRRIEAAQKEILKKSVSDLVTGSSREWIRRNCPEMWREMQ